MTAEEFNNPYFKSGYLAGEAERVALATENDRLRFELMACEDAWEDC